MNYIELSINDVANKCKQLHAQIAKDYDYDLVIFIARGAFIIGVNMSELNNCELVEIFAKRKKTVLKSKISVLLKIIPKKIRIALRKKELSKNMCNNDSERSISYSEKKFTSLNPKKILIVDDSVDTGNTMKQCVSVVSKCFKNAEIKTAAMNIMSAASSRPDYALYEDKIISGPWSSDSKCNKVMLEMYKEWKDEYEK